MWYKTMDMFEGVYTKQHDKMRSTLYIDGVDYHGNMTNLVIIRFDLSWILKFMARATILALVIVSLPWINMMIVYLLRFQSNNFIVEMANNPIDLDFLPVIFQDLANEGLIRMGDRSLLVSNGNENEEAIYNSQVVKDYNPDLISFSDYERQNLVSNETFDFVFSYGFPHESTNFIERALKVGGVLLVVPLSDNALSNFPQPSNYKIVYVRKFDLTIVAMKKTKNVNKHPSTGRRRLCALETNTRGQVSSSNSENTKFLSKFSRPIRRDSARLFESVDFEYQMAKAEKVNAKEEALKKLKDVLLEPPRAASGKSSRYLKKTRYLPDLMDVSLKSYPRRVFIDVGLQEKNEKSSWFSMHYPTRNTKFEIFKIETMTKKNHYIQLLVCLIG